MKPKAILMADVANLYLAHRWPDSCFSFKDFERILGVITDYAVGNFNLVMRRAYGFFRPGERPNSEELEGLPPEVKSIVLRLGYRLSEQHAKSSDIHLAVDLLELAWDHPEIETFIVASSDRDYIPAYRVLHRKDRAVLVIGYATKISRHLPRQVKAFVPIEELMIGDLRQYWSAVTEAFAETVESRIGAVCRDQFENRLAEKIGDDQTAQFVVDELIRRKLLVPSRGFSRQSSDPCYRLITK